jgi:hypothetical protein
VVSGDSEGWRSEGLGVSIEVGSAVRVKGRWSSQLCGIERGGYLKIVAQWRLA